MLLIGILSLILYSSYKEYTIKELKEVIMVSALLVIYSMTILWNSTSLITIGKGLSILNNNFLITPYTVSIQYLVLILVLLYLILIYQYINSNNNNGSIKTLLTMNEPSNEFIILVLLNVFAITLFIEASNSLVIFIMIELQSYTLYIITTSFYKNDSNNKLSINSAKSGLIYFLLGSVASILILIGLALIYSETGLINIIDIMMYLNVNILNVNTNIISLSLILIFVGLLFKIGIAPLHTWLINIYNDVPTVVTVWISLVTKVSIFTFIYTILHLYNYIYISNSNVINILQFIAILSMIIGGINGLSQISLKKLLAYSGLVNSGYILYSLIGNNQYSLLAYIFNIYQYSLTHFNIFFIIILTLIYYKTWYNYALSQLSTDEINNSNIKSNRISNTITTYINIKDLYSFISCNRALTLCYIICLASFMGIPPLTGFYGKYYLLIAGLLSGYWFGALVLILVSCMTAYYYGYVIRTLTNTKLMENTSNNKYISQDILTINNNISGTLSYTISLLSLLILMPLLSLDIYINGSVILDYYQWVL